MLKKLLGDKLYEYINATFDLRLVCEVRLRINSPIIVSFNGFNLYLKGRNGEILYSTREDIERVVAVASNYSLYTVDNQIKQAFITAEQGYRIGVCGEMLIGSGSSVKTIKNIYSVNIRVPHDVKGCSQKLMQFIKNDCNVKSTLIISPPGLGKTTFLRDITCQLSNTQKPINILLIDERYEIAGVKNGIPTIQVGCCCDILSGASKEYGFVNGIRSLRPDVIVTDEISGIDDTMSILNAVNSGVKVIASIHADSLDMLFNKNELELLLKTYAFERYVVLKNNLNKGRYFEVYDEYFKKVYG